MIADYNEVPAATYTDLPRDDRLELIYEAIEALSVATEALRRVVKAELDNRNGSEDTNEAHLTSIHQLGHHVIKLARTASETNSSDEAFTLQDGTDTDMLEPEVKEIIIQPDVDTENPTKPLRKKQNNYRKNKSYPIPSDNRLYAQILTEEEMPPIEIAEDADPIEIEIISDEIILFNGKEIKLTGDALFVFNALMSLRDQQAIASKMIREQGYRIPASPTASTNLGITLKKLRHQLTSETESGVIELIGRQGEGSHTTYFVNPAIVKNSIIREKSPMTPGITDGDNHQEETFGIDDSQQEIPETTIEIDLQDLPVEAELDVANQADTETSNADNTEDAPSTPQPEIKESPSEDNAITLEAEIKALRQGEGPISVKSLPAHTVKRLYAQVAFADEVPSIETNEGDEPIRIRIISEKSIAIADKVKMLDGDDLFLLNAFMKLRDKDVITAGDIRELGYRQGMSGASTASLITAIERLRRYLQVESEDGTVELISKQEGEDYDTYKVNEATISTEVVREGSTLIIQYLDKNDSDTEVAEEDDLMVVRIAKKNEHLDSNGDTTTLDLTSPLAATLIGAKIGEERDFKAPNVEAIKVKVVEIE